MSTRSADSATSKIPAEIATRTVSGIKVSVLVMTYNHARFIDEALRSVLMQRVNFTYEILISEDCSTDGTREIVLRYQQAHPARIRLLLSETNIHGNAIVTRGIEAARGQYIALLDGDDYWTSPSKLQKQVDFLDAHPDCSICFHNAKVIHEDGSREPWNWTPAQQSVYSSLEELWLGNFIPTCSTMYRNVLRTIPAWYTTFAPPGSVFITDWPLHILHAERGRIAYIDEVMGVYRLHGGGLYSTFSEHDKLDKTLAFYRAIDAAMDYKYHANIQVAISKYFFEWAEEYQSRADPARARECLLRCLRGKPVNRYLSLRQLLRLGAKLYAPGLLRVRNRMTAIVNRLASN